MDTLAPGSDEGRDGALGTDGLEELDVGRSFGAAGDTMTARRQEGGSYVLLLDGFYAVERQAQYALIEVERRLDVKTAIPT